MKLATKLSHFFTKNMNALADFIGRPIVFATVVLVVAGWFVAGRFIEYDTWFDIMDVSIFIFTFFMLFVVQSSQNADTKAIQDKLDELIDNLPGANTKKEGEEEDFKQGKDAPEK